MKLSGFVSLITLGAMSLIFSGCQPTKDHHGNIVFCNAIGSFEVGKTKASEVVDRCGTPSIYRDPLTWIYIKYRSEEIAFRQEEAIDKYVVRMKFDQNGVLQSLNIIDARKCRNVVEDEDITESLVQRRKMPNKKAAK
ncbi:MAG: hypothetical protein LBJ19_02730 [Holosporaceae bacterium]|nr:hypothetical protein [Holosporaceae bacterium]